MIAHPLICWALIGSEEVGHIIEEPFGSQVTSLPLRSRKGTPSRECVCVCVAFFFSWWAVKCAEERRVLLDASSRSFSHATSGR